MINYLFSGIDKQKGFTKRQEQNYQINIYFYIDIIKCLYYHKR